MQSATREISESELIENGASENGADDTISPQPRETAVSSQPNQSIAPNESVQNDENNLAEIRGANSLISDPNNVNSDNGGDINIDNGDDAIANLSTITYKLIPGRRANSEILYSLEEKQFYIKKRKLASGVLSLVCRTNGCKNHCYLDSEKNICKLPVPYVPHAHPTQEDEYKKICVLNKIKSDCANPNIVAKTETKTSVVKSIFKEKITENEDSTIQYHRIERTLRRIASKTMPPAPKSIEQIGSTFENEHVNRLYGQTLHKTDVEKNQFYRTTHVEDEFAHSVFASQRCIDLIENHYGVDERKYCIDATFKVVPHLFYQLLIIYFETPTKQVKNLFQMH